MDTTITINDTHDKLMTMLLDRMNTEDQHLFVLSFRTYLEYGYDNSAFVIDFDYVWKWVGYGQKGHAKRLLQKCFEKDKEYTEQIDIQGSSHKETIMLTVNTFKTFCMSASTKRAREIHNYYVKMEGIFFEYFKDQLNKKNQLVIDMEINNVENVEKERHNVLKKAHHKKNLVYIMKLQIFPDESFVIKVGFTDNIMDRCCKLSAEFGPLVLLDVFPCDNNMQFERFILEYPNFLNIKYDKFINNRKKSTEAFLVKDKNHYNQLIHIIQKNLYKFESSTERLKLEIESKRLDIELKKKTMDHDIDNQKLEILKLVVKHEMNLTEFKEALNLMMNKDVEQSNDNEIIQPIQSHEDIVTQLSQEQLIVTPPIPHSHQNRSIAGPIVQLYDKDDITKLLHIYDSITEAVREIPETSFTQIKHAAKNKQIYREFRWFLVDRHSPNARIFNNIGETFNHTIKKTGMVAMLNMDKTKVINVFGNQKMAAEHLSQHHSAMSHAIKYNVVLSGHYWRMWDELDTELTVEYEDNSELPVRLPLKRGVQVQQIDPDTNLIVNIFNSISNVCKLFKISPKTLKEKAAEKIAHNGYKWNII